MDRVSVVIPCFNAERYITETLASVLSQTRVPDEIIVVDDGSTDRSAEAAKAVDRRVRVVQQSNAGESSARNRGIEESTGEWVAFLDADDSWLPEKLESQLAACRHQPDVVCCHTAVIHQYGDTFLRLEVPDVLHRGDYSIANMLLHFMVHPSSALVRRSLPVRFPEWTRSGEDLLYFAEVSSCGRMLYLPQALVRYRRHDAAQSANVTNIVKNRESCLRWLNLNGGAIPADQRTEAEALLIDDLIERLRVLKWKREWQRYWPIRRFLREYYDSARQPAPSEVREFVWPPTVYRLRDWLDKPGDRS